ncbi:MAG: hypothetical protein IJT97_00225 [Bacteroidaceae bacterium]|nr:hypothetical protein [Bacteroidaceae bacterium]
MKLLFLFLILSLPLQAQTWTVEAEDVASSVTWKGHEADIIAPKGLTLWCNELMTGNTVIEYEAQITKDKHFLDKEGKPRISDLNCFWMADHLLGRQGANFTEHYALQAYYMGYGGNWNTTTRFRRYNGDKRGIDSIQYRPIVLKEYTDALHLLKANHWYKIRLEQTDGRVRYFIDGECLVDYLDPKPLTQGYFGFRTTLSHAKLRNFHYSCINPNDNPVVLRWIGNETPIISTPVTFGVPFSQGEVKTENFTLKTCKGEEIPIDTWQLASWPDGSSKWQAFSAVIPANTDSCLLQPLSSQPPQIAPQTTCTLPLIGNHFWLTLNHQPCHLLSTETEQNGLVRTTLKYTYDHAIVRAYIYKDIKQIKLVHTLLVDSALNADGLSELSLHFKIPMHGPAYERYVAFPLEKKLRKVSEREAMSVQPLIARRPIDLQAMDSVTREMLANIAQWDGFRLSQLSPNAYSIRKRTTRQSPWIGTIEGLRSNGIVTVGDSTSSVSFCLRDFWQSYPSTLQVDGARSDTATVTISLYSPEAETYNFAHYDTINHTLEAAYEDVQPGMSTAWGIARTSEISISIDGGIERDARLACTPEYFHRKRVFGIWSLPTIETPRDTLIENTLSSLITFYNDEIHRNHWYGYFDYGDVMHAYDTSRGEWRYDVGGYAWDNTELGTPAMFWYQFLRTGDKLTYRMAEAMTRHCSEVDTYHFGPHAGLGTRHNVTHWGCGAKEARISEAWWNRFYYYLTADERIGDIMHEVRDADTLLYTLDPMRLAQPRDQFPCTAPARLRIGPDWLAYVSNWFTEWERSGEVFYLNKILAGMNSIANFPHGFFEGPKALGYDPATGIIINECDSNIQNTNHLLSIMGGFELMNELQLSIDHPQFFAQWLNHCKEYKQKAWEISRNKFRIPRITAYAAWRLGDEKLRQIALKDFFDRRPVLHGADIFWTNEAAAWTHDAIFIKEVLR